MSDFIGIDTSELSRLSVDLKAAGALANADAAGVIKKAAVNIKKTAQQLAPKGPHTPYYANSITYDYELTSSGPAAEIGPVKSKKQGSLGNIFEYGTSKQGPKPHLLPALNKEVPTVERLLGAKVVKLIGGSQ